MNWFQNLCEGGVIIIPAPAAPAGGRGTNVQNGAATTPTGPAPTFTPLPPPKPWYVWPIIFPFS